MSDERKAGLLLLILYTLVAMIALPFALVLPLYAPMLVGSESRPDTPLVAVTMLALLVLPLLLLVGPVGAWIGWFRRRGRAPWIYALLPIGYGGLVVIALNAFVG